MAKSPRPEKGSGPAWAGPPDSRADWAATLRATADDGLAWPVYADWLRENEEYEMGERLAELLALGQPLAPIRPAALEPVVANVMKVRKKSGGVRTIYCPDPATKSRLRRLNRVLLRLQAQILLDCVHGFRSCRSPLTAARQHVGRRWTLSADLADHFDTIGPDHLRDVLPEQLMWQCLFKGRTRQGLPTSPAASNIGTHRLDQAILAAFPGVVYTRYADDLTFSADDRETLAVVRERLPEMAAALGHQVNEKKWRLQGGGPRRRIILGVSVGADSVRAPRKARRKLAAMAHSRPYGMKTRGLRGWVHSCGV